MNTTQQWHVDGAYFEACSCKGACPCLYGADPTEDTCDALVAWHVDRGRYGDVDLQGKNVAMALHTPGNMTEGNWKVVVYVDDSASKEQHEALVKIFGGEAGGHPATLAQFVGEILAVESVPMHYQGEGRKRSLKVGDIGEAKFEAIEGQDGGDVTITGHPVAISPGQNLVVAKSEVTAHQGHGMNWEFTDRVAYYSPFRYEAA